MELVAEISLAPAISTRSPMQNCHLQVLHVNLHKVDLDRQHPTVVAALQSTHTTAYATRFGEPGSIIPGSRGSADTLGSCTKTGNPTLADSILKGSASPNKGKQTHFSKRGFLPRESLLREACKPTSFHRALRCGLRACDRRSSFEGRATSVGARQRWS